MENEIIKKKGNKKVPKYVGITFACLIGIFAISIIYTSIAYNSQKYLDDNVKKINTYIDKMFNNISSNESNELDIVNLDQITTSKTSIKTNSKELKDLESLSVNSIIKSSLKNNYEEVNLDLLNNNSSVLNANFSINNSNLFIESNILNNPLKTDITKNESNINFDDLKELMNADTLKNIIKKTFEYSATALKESDTKTINKGIKIDYVYKITGKNKEKVLAKFKDLIENDDDFNIIREIFSNDFDEIALEPMEIRVSINPFNKKLTSFQINVDDATYYGKKIGENKYQIGNNDEYSEIEIYDNKITITDYTNKKSSAQGSIEIFDKEIKLYLNAEELDFTANIKNEESTFKIENKDVVIDGIIKNNLDYNNKKISQTFAVNINVYGYKLTLNIDSNTEFGENIVKPKEITNAKDMSSLTDEEIANITQNAFTNLSKIDLFASLIELIGNIDDFDSLLDDEMDFNEF